MLDSITIFSKGGILSTLPVVWQHSTTGQISTFRCVNTRPNEATLKEFESLKQSCVQQYVLNHIAKGMPQRCSDLWSKKMLKMMYNGHWTFFTIVNKVYTICYINMLCLSVSLPHSCTCPCIMSALSIENNYSALHPTNLNNTRNTRAQNIIWSSQKLGLVWPRMV